MVAICNWETGFLKNGNLVYSALWTSFGRSSHRVTNFFPKLLSMPLFLPIKLNFYFLFEIHKFPNCLADLAEDTTGVGIMNALMGK